MGNCVQSNSSSNSCGAAVGEAGRQLPGPRRSAAGEDEDADEGVAAVAPSSVVKLKMVLTKDELGWLVAQLKAGDRRLEDVLQEMMARKRELGRADGWRPSLESIVECSAEQAAPTAGSDD